MKKSYHDEIVHLVGAIHENVGTLVCGPGAAVHPFGDGWFRIKNPCVAFQVQNEQTKTVENGIMPIAGINQIYKPVIDIYIPESIMEIKVLDERGDLYKNYVAAIELKAPSKKSGIVLAGPGALAGLKPPSVH